MYLGRRLISLLTHCLKLVLDKVLKRVVPLLFLGLGVFLLIQVVMPLISYKLWEFSLYQQNKPLVSSTPSELKIPGIYVQENSSFPAIISDNKRTDELPYLEFLISVPAIKLSKIKVKVETNDFENSLAHLPGTSLPGERGNVFVTGHSSLSTLYRPDNFKAIFANLPQLKKGDSVYTETNNQVFEYKVVSIKIVDPRDITVINPPDTTGRYLTLMTCVPPGLYLKRLIILAELI